MVIAARVVSIFMRLGFLIFFGELLSSHDLPANRRRRPAACPRDPVLLFHNYQYVVSKPAIKLFTSYAI